MKTQFKKRFVVYVVNLLLGVFSLLQIGCVDLQLKKMSGGLSKASEDVVRAKKPNNINNQKSETKDKVRINCSLFDNPGFGKMYAYKTRSTRIESRSKEIKNTWTGEITKGNFEAMIITVQLEAISENWKQEGIPQLYELEECVGMYGEIDFVLHRCAWFRIQFPKDKVQDEAISVVRGFDSTGRCIYYYESNLKLKKESNSKAQLVPNSKIETYIKIPKMREPL